MIYDWWRISISHFVSRRFPIGSVLGLNASTAIHNITPGLGIVASSSRTCTLRFVVLKIHIMLGLDDFTVIQQSIGYVWRKSSGSMFFRIHPKRDGEIAWWWCGNQKQPQKKENQMCTFSSEPTLTELIWAVEWMILCKIACHKGGVPWFLCLVFTKIAPHGLHKVQPKDSSNTAVPMTPLPRVLVL